MKKLLPLTVCAWLLTAALCLAHSLPDTEACVGGIGPGCTLGYVKSIYGEPTSAKRFSSDGVRVATYWYGDGFRVIGRVGSSDTREEDELPVVGYSLTDSSLSTPSGITVGMPYARVADQFGTGNSISFSGKTGYAYPLGGQREMSFFLDSQGNISEISLGTGF